MIVSIQSSSIHGTIHAPASKSCTQRAFAAALIKKGISIIKNCGKSDDEMVGLNIIKTLGAKVEEANDAVIVTSNGIQPIANRINCGESGLSLRLFTPVAALSNQSLSIEGYGTLIKRPVDVFYTILPQLKVQVISVTENLPLIIKGPLQPANIEIDGSVSSQFLTGLLMAFSSGITQPATIKVKNLKSKPYIDLTIQVMKAFGLMVVNNNSSYESFTIFPQEKQKEEVHYTVEGDWSSSSFMLVAGAIAGKVSVSGLDINSTQADKAILHALLETGCRISITDELIAVEKSSLKPFHFNAVDCPDLFPPLVALAANCNGTSSIEGVTRLQHKESNRAISLQSEFKKMNVEIELEGNTMLITGGKPIISAAVHSHNDHRIAMACAVAALNADGETLIHEAEAINKSYPDFYHHFQQLGATIFVK